MSWKEYSEFVQELNFTRLADLDYDLAHHAMSLCSEAGEIAGKVVKTQWRGSKNITKAQILSEVGDVFFHVTALLTNLGSNIDQCMEENMKKLGKRVEDGTLVGEGDDR